MKFAAFTLLAATAAVLLSCASAPSSDQVSQVRVFNVYRTGAEVPPSLIHGCESLGAVSATAPEYDAQGAGFFDPKGLLPTIRARAAAKLADVVVVAFKPGALEHERRTIRGNAFRCRTQSVPLEFGDELR